MHSFDLRTNEPTANRQQSDFLFDIWLLGVIIILIGLPAPLNDVAQGRRFFMTTHIVKTPADYPAQVKKLIEHGIVIEDLAACERFLPHVSYYRFSAYFLQYSLIPWLCFLVAISRQSFLSVSFPFFFKFALSYLMMVCWSIG